MGGRAPHALADASLGRLWEAALEVEGRHLVSGVLSSQASVQPVAGLPPVPIRELGEFYITELWSSDLRMFVVRCSVVLRAGHLRESVNSVR